MSIISVDQSTVSYSSRLNHSAVIFAFIFHTLDVVVWGNEHECQPRLSESLVGTYRIYQPGTYYSRNPESSYYCAINLFSTLKCSCGYDNILLSYVSEIYQM